jgi:hypothetical protein
LKKERWKSPDIAKAFGVGRSTVDRWVQMCKEQGHCQAKKCPGKKCGIDPEKFREFFKANSSLTAAEMGENVGFALQLFAIGPKRSVGRIRKTFYMGDPQKIRPLRKAYKLEFKHVKKKTRIYMDESGMDISARAACG